MFTVPEIVYAEINRTVVFVPLLDKYEQMNRVFTYYTVVAANNESNEYSILAPAECVKKRSFYNFERDVQIEFPDNSAYFSPTML